jgi:hypothetical protein
VRHARKPTPGAVYDQGMERSVRIATEFGAHLIGREIGAAIRRQHYAGARESWPEALDFSGVEQATESCVDELLGTLAKQHGMDSIRSIAIHGACPGVKETIDYIVSILDTPPAVVDAAVVRRILSPPRKMTKAESARTKRSASR